MWKHFFVLQAMLEWNHRMNLSCRSSHCAIIFSSTHSIFSPLSASAAVCQRRIRTTRKMQDDQFKSEIKNLEAMQATAYDQIRVHRSVGVRCLFRWKLIEFSISIVLRASRLLCATQSLETERRFFHCNNFFRSTLSFFARFFTITTLWPPLHSCREVSSTLGKFHVLPRRHVERINCILKSEYWIESARECRCWFEWVLEGDGGEANQIITSY